MKVWLRGTLFEPEWLPEIAQAAERSGFYGIGLSDHILYPYDLGSRYPYAEEGYSADAAWPDPWVAAAALAASTTTLRLATWIYIAAARSPLVVAKAVATAAAFAGGRLSFGGAIGWLPEEYEAMGVDFASRGRRFGEMCDLLRTIWQGGWIEHRGDFFQLERCLLSPTPPYPIPIWLGGDSDSALRRAASFDGWLGLPYDLETAERNVQRLNEFREAAGTYDRDDYEIMTGFARVPTVDDLRALKDVGVTSVIVAPWERDHKFLEKVSPEVAVEYLEEYGETVLGELARV